MDAELYRNTDLSLNRDQIYDPPFSSSLKPTKILHILAHSPCRDGFASMWAHYQSMLLHPPAEPTKVIYTPENHRWGKTKDLLASPTISQEEVIYLDICPRRDLLEALFQKAGKVQVYDHHISAQRECGDLPYCFFDMDRSGAGIAWDTFCRTPRPYMIDCIEDGDIWRWTVQDSKYVLIYMEVNVRFKFDQFTEFSKLLETDRRPIVEEGKHYHHYRNIVTQMLTGRKVHKLDLKGITLPAVNASIFQSGVGNILATKLKPHAAAVYYWNGQYWAFSLRSTDKGPDVSKIAEQWGGGGHRNAAGFRVDDLADLKFIPYEDDEISEIEAVVSPDLATSDLTNEQTWYF